MTGHTILIDSSIEDLSENNVYYTINIAEHISEFTNGQYDYSVINGNKKVASGIAQYGVYAPEIKTYDIPDTEIKTYER